MLLNTGKVLREKLEERRGLLVPGAANALTARIIEDLGFEAVYVSGAGVTNSHWGAPDLGFISLPEIAQHTLAIREAVKIPVLSLVVGIVIGPKVAGVACRRPS